MNNQHNSRIIISNQASVHDDLEAVLNKHIQHDFHKPISDINQRVFEQVQHLYEQHSNNFILDSGCGVGESTYHIAQANPDCFVLGVDQSSHRIENNNNWTLPENAQLIQANLIDFWRLAEQSNWLLYKHYLLYPNPWPKKKHLQRRWHGHPVFPVLKTLSGQLEMRTNWKIYAEEFKLAIELLMNKDCALKLWTPEHAMTPFERKYQQSAQDLYQVKIDLRS